MNVSPDSRVCVLFISADIKKAAGIEVIVPPVTCDGCTGRHPNRGVG
jgi:hypothetical protein